MADNAIVYSCGSNIFEELGNSEYNISAVDIPVEIMTFYEETYPTAIAAGDNLTLFLFNGNNCFRKFNADPSVCSTKDNCTAFNHCHCKDYYNAADCSTYYCFAKIVTDSDICNGQGTCVDADEWVCKPGYIREICETAISGYVFTIEDGSNEEIGDGYLFSTITTASEVSGTLAGTSVIFSKEQEC